MQLTFGEAGRVTEEPAHDVRATIVVLDALAQDHVAAALAVDRTRLRKTVQACCKLPCRRERVRMQFRVTARQPAAVGALRWRFIGQWRKWQDLRPGAPPGFQNMRINEAECPILRQRDALSRRRQEASLTVAPRPDDQRPSGGDDRIEIEVPFCRRGEPFDQRGQIGMLGGLHQAEMPLRQGKRGIARHRAKDGKPDGVDGAGNERTMPLARRAIENNTGDFHGRIVRGKTARYGGRRLRLSCDIEYQHHGQIEMCGEIGGRAASAGACRRAVEQAHDAFDHENVCAVRGAGGQRIEQRLRHGPGIEIDDRVSASRGVKRRIDIVRTRFRRADFQATPLERCHKRERYRGFAGAGLRRGDDQATRGHFGSTAALGPASASSSRSLTTSPITTMAGGSSFCARASPARFSSVETRTRCFGVDAEMMTAAGVPVARPASSIAATIRSRLCMTMYSTIGCPVCASGAQSKSSSAPWPAAKMTARLIPRSVAGMPAAASAARPAVTPGMMRNGMPARASVMASSPPRPNTKGSPPLRRSTRWRARASAMRRSLMSACNGEGLPPRLPANSSRA